ncbi:DUF1214 domain-containing protein [Cellulomonas sp. Marseille-Q8402]
MPEALSGTTGVAHDPEVVRAAAEAYVWARPALLGYRELRTEVRTGVAAFDVFHHDEAPPAPGDGSRWADPTLLRSSAWLDLRAEPAVIGHPELPGDAYAGFQVVDLLARTVAHLGVVATGPAAADWVVAGTAWAGTRPPAVRGVLRTGSGLVRVVARTAATGPGDPRDRLAAARARQAAYRVRPLHDLGGVPPPRPAPSVDWLPWDEDRAWGPGFVDYLALLLRLVHPEDPDDRALVDRWRRLGVLPDPHTPHPSARTRSLVARGAALGAAQLQDAAQRDGDALPPALRRAVAAAVELHAPEPTEIRTLRWRRTGDDPLDGHRRYRLTLPARTPARLSWSLTAYAEPSGDLVASPLRRDALHPGVPGLPWGPDGSLVVAVSHLPPAGASAGVPAAWLPAPAGPFQLVLRLYGPRPDPPGGWAPVLRAVG